MDVREKLVDIVCDATQINGCNHSCNHSPCAMVWGIVDALIKHGVTVQECAYWQYIDDDVDEDNNIQAYCSACHAGDKHATKMIGKVPYCWKCGRKMMPPPQEGE